MKFNCQLHAYLSIGVVIDATTAEAAIALAHEMWNCDDGVLDEHNGAAVFKNLERVEAYALADDDDGYGGHRRGAKPDAEWRMEGEGFLLGVKG